jgi:hypothetical protein
MNVQGWAGQLLPQTQEFYFTLNAFVCGMCLTAKGRLIQSFK